MLLILLFFCRQGFWFIYSVVSPRTRPLGEYDWFLSILFVSNPMRFPLPWRLYLTTSTPSPPESERWSSRREMEWSVRRKTSPDLWKTFSPGEDFCGNIGHDQNTVDVQTLKPFFLTKTSWELSAGRSVNKACRQKMDRATDSLIHLFWKPYILALWCGVFGDTIQVEVEKVIS